MADVINLRAARKRAKRRQDELQAGANRAAHGKPQSERELDAARRAKANRDLEKHRMERGDG